MGTYLYETHCHTSQVSRCGELPAETVVRNYIDAGYSGIIVTDHFSRVFQQAKMRPDATWDEKIDFFLTGYQAAADEAARLKPEFKVLFGLELRLDCDSDNDFLIYGADDAFLRAHPNILQMNFEDMAACVHQAGLLIVQAHPFRECMTIVDWNLLDGVEVFNGNPNHESNNPIADAWAERHHLLKTSGSDYHGEWGAKKGGIRTAEPIQNNQMLLDILKSGKYELI